MTEKTKWVVSRDEVQEKINELTEHRDEFVQQANMQVLSFESQIRVLEDLIAPEPEESYDPASEPID